MNIFVDLDTGEQDAQQHRDEQAIDETLAIIMQQGMVCPGHRRTRQQQDDGVVKRQVKRIENLDTDRRPGAARVLHPCDLGSLTGKDCGIEECPEPGHEKHHFRSDEHDHSIAQVQRYDRRMVAFMGFLDAIGPPAVHGVEHDHQTNEEQPRIGHFQSEHLK